MRRTLTKQQIAEIRGRTHADQMMAARRDKPCKGSRQLPPTWTATWTIGEILRPLESNHDAVTFPWQVYANHGADVRDALRDEIARLRQWDHVPKADLCYLRPIFFIWPWLPAELRNTLTFVWNAGLEDAKVRVMGNYGSGTIGDEVKFHDKGAE